MKRFYNFFTVVCMLLVSGICQAQDTLPNTGFERWNNDNGYEEPEGWSTLNALSAFGYPLTVTKTTDTYAGTYAMRLECQEFQGDIIDGVAIIGDLLAEEYGMSWQTRNAKLTCAYKAYPAEGDTSAIYAVMYRWNSDTQHSDTVAEAVLLIGDTVSAWTLADIPFVYHSNEDPDSLLVIFSASLDGFNPTLGSVMYIDALSVSSPTNGIVNVNPKTILPVYPNPAADMLYLPLTKPNEVVTLYDMQGREAAVRTRDTNGAISVKDMAEGLYLVKTAAFTQRVLIKH